MSCAEAFTEPCGSDLVSTTFRRDLGDDILALGRRDPTSLEELSLRVRFALGGDFLVGFFEAADVDVLQ